ncbi:MAG: hypothetical protein U5L09_09020 [Bacteroidales bacterium]|nr:hypothetical protein [Bacteroidales bacterium]
MIRVFFSKIILPLPFFALLILTGAFAFYFKKKRTGKVLFIVGIAGLFLFSFHWIPDFMAGTLENRYTSIASEALQNQENPDIPVWVLGGGHTYDNRLSATSQLSSHALGRLSEAFACNEPYRQPTIVGEWWKQYRPKNSGRDIKRSSN